MIHSFTDTFGAKYLTGMVTSDPPYETFSLIKNNILHQSKINSNFEIMLFISTGIFNDKLRLQILSQMPF